MNPRHIETAEYLAGALLSGILYFALLHGHWLMFCLLLFLPDLSMLAYLGNNSVGAFVYNLFHTFVVPIVLIVIGLVFKLNLLPLIALIWLTHITLDRALGFGLKYDDNFNHTT